MLSVYSLFLAIASMLILTGMLLSPSEPANSVLFGLSLPRLILALGLFTAFCFFTFISIKALSKRGWANEVLERWFGNSPLSPVIAALSGVTFGLGWIGCFLPAYRTGVLAAYWVRIRPAMVFLLVVGFATLVIALVKRMNFRAPNLVGSKAFKSSLILFFPALLLIGIMLYTDFGVSAPEDYWYGAGVPILISQLMMAIFAGLVFLQAEKRLASKQFDLVIFFLIFVVTAVLWAREPLQKSFLFIGPYAPNRVLYPFADAAIFDTASQFALIGQKFFIFGGQFFERALYISFLVYLHSLFGQDYAQLMAAQAAIYAVFPALVYLVGKSVHSRTVGCVAAAVAAFRGANAIAASNMIDMANPKMMLTDFPTAIGIALIVLFTCELLKKPLQKSHYALWLGGVIGLTVMLRTNALMLLVFLPLFTFFRFSPRWKPWLISSFLIVLATFAVTLPWELRNQSLGGQMYASIVAKFQNVLQRRYTPPVQPNTQLPNHESLSSLWLRNSWTLLALTADTDALQEPPCSTTACFVPNHFLHNILTSVLILPTSPVLDDLRHTVRESHPYWQPDWDGSFSTTSLFVFGLNLFFIVLGIYMTWEQNRLAGLAPLAIFMFYNLSNGLARTSGGRYIVPIDWIVAVYFLIGILHVIRQLANHLGIGWTLSSTPDTPNTGIQSAPRPDLSRALIILTTLFGLGTLIPLAETLHSNPYQGTDISRLLTEHQSQFAAAGLSADEINSFLQDPNARISFGRALYPRYYIENEGEVHFYPMVVMGFPRTTFTLIGPAGEQGIVLPGEKPGYFPHAVDTLVLGCQEQFYTDALAVVVLDEGVVYTRSPESSLQCPLSQPVCDNNHNCY